MLYLGKDSIVSDHVTKLLLKGNPQPTTTANSINTKVLIKKLLNGENIDQTTAMEQGLWHSSLCPNNRLGAAGAGAHLAAMGLGTSPTPQQHPQTRAFILHAVFPPPPLREAFAPHLPAVLSARQ